MAAVLMIGAGLLIRSLWILQQVDPGFVATGVLKAEFQLPFRRYPQDYTKFPNWPAHQRFYGELLSLTDSDVELNSSLVGRVHISRESIRRLFRWKGAETIYHGPNGLAGWSAPNAAARWIDQAGKLYSDQRGASIFSDLRIPEKAAIEIELSWNKKPDFTLMLGVDEKDRTGKNAYRFEV
jgi:hypothetical protein